MVWADAFELAVMFTANSVQIHARRMRVHVRKQATFLRGVGGGYSVNLTAFFSYLCLSIPLPFPFPRLVPAIRQQEAKEKKRTVTEKNPKRRSCSFSACFLPDVPKTWWLRLLASVGY